MIEKIKESPKKALLAIQLFLFGLFSVLSLSAETEVRTNLELYNTAYRGRNDSWYYTGNGKADIRFGSVGNDNMRAEASVEFYPVDLTGGTPISSTPAMTLKRLWIKANFPGWRLTAGKTKLPWGNGYVYNSGDVLFGSIGPFVDFTQSTIRDDTSWLTAVNIPTGDFSYIEAVVLPPSLEVDDSNITVQTIDKTSGGLRFFARAGGWRLETGYVYKGDSKAAQDLLGHRPYFSIHGHAGVDLYGSVSLAAGWDSKAEVNRDTWDEISHTVNMSFGAFHQLQTGYNSTLTIRLEGLVFPWQNWSRKPYQQLIDGNAGYYGMFIYPELTWMFRSTWYVGGQAIISPVDASAQITTTFGWHVFQGFTLLAFVVVNAGDDDSLFAWDRSSKWPTYPNVSPATEFADYEFNGVNLTLGARYSF